MIGRQFLCTGASKTPFVRSPAWISSTLSSQPIRHFFWQKKKPTVDETAVAQQQQPDEKLKQQHHNKQGSMTAAGGNISDKIHLKNIKHVITVCSAKGGVGKSTVSSNVALALAHHHHKTVGLLDADIYGPSMHRMMGIKTREKQVNPLNNMLIPASNYGVRVMSMGMIVPDDSPAIWRGPMVMGALNQLLTQTEWQELDYLVVDLPPGTGDAQLTLCQRVKMDGAIIVSTPQDIALIDAKRGINMFRKVQVPVLGIVENMSYHICSNCGHEEHIFGHGGAEKCAQEMDIPFMGHIPLHIDIREKSDIGAPIVVSQPQSEHAKRFYEITQKIIDAVERERGDESEGPEIVIE